MESIKIAVVGRTLNDKRWDLVYELLEDGIEAEVLKSFDKYNVDSTKVIPNHDAYIYIATTPKVKDKPFIHLQANASEDDIDDAMLGLVQKLIKKPEQKSEPVVEDSIQRSKIDGLVIEVNGKEIYLEKEDFLELKEILRLCEVYKFKVKDVITDGD
jgi:hypothetical protein